MWHAAPKATPPARERRGGEKSSSIDADAASMAASTSTPNCVLGALPSPFGSAASSATGKTPGSDATCRVTTRRQSRLSAAAAAATANAIASAAAGDAASLQPPPQQPPSLPTDSLFAPLAAGLRTRSSLSFEDKVTASSATLLDPSPSLLNPETFAFSRAFEFERVIGRSALSEVWLARHKSSGKLFAVKRSAPSAAGAFASASASAAPAAASSAAAARSRKTASEVSVVASVPPHPNLVGVLRSWREEGGGMGGGGGGGWAAGSFIQMDYCRGGSLAESIRRASKRSRRIRRRRSSGGGGGGGGSGGSSGDGGREESDEKASPPLPVPAALPEAAVWRVAAHASAALEALHSSRVIHMDVKPENIYLDWREEEEEEEEEQARAGVPAVVLRLGDFGISISFSTPTPAESGGGDGGGGRDEEGEGEAPWEEGDGRYVAPELLLLSSSPSSSSSASSSRPTPSADVFSLGATLFECATGAPPPRGDGSLPSREVAARVLEGLSASSPSAASLADLIASSMLPDPRARPSAARLARAAAEGDATCREGEADKALTSGLFGAAAAAAAATAGAATAGHSLGAAPSFSLLRRSDARRRGYTLDGSASLSLSAGEGGEGEEGGAGGAGGGGSGEEAKKKKKKRPGGGEDQDLLDDGGDSAEDDDDSDSDALLSSRPPSAPRAGHSRRRTPRSAPPSPEGKDRAEASLFLLAPSSQLAASAAEGAAAARPPLAPLPLLEPLVEAMSIGGGGSGGGSGRGEGTGKPASPRLDLDLERALSSMSIDGAAGAENALSPGSPERSSSPWPVAAARDAARGAPPAPSSAPLGGGPRCPCPSSSRRLGFGFGFGLLPGPPALAPSLAAASLDEQGHQEDLLSVEGLGGTVRQLSMSVSGRELLQVAPTTTTTTSVGRR